MMVWLEHIAYAHPVLLYYCIISAASVGVHRRCTQLDVIQPSPAEHQQDDNDNDNDEFNKRRTNAIRKL